MQRHSSHSPQLSPVRPEQCSCKVSAPSAPTKNDLSAGYLELPGRAITPGALDPSPQSEGSLGQISCEYSGEFARNGAGGNPRGSVLRVPAALTEGIEGNQLGGQGDESRALTMPWTELRVTSGAGRCAGECPGKAWSSTANYAGRREFFFEGNPWRS